MKRRLRLAKVNPARLTRAVPDNKRPDIYHTPKLQKIQICSVPFSDKFALFRGVQIKT
jgi:hypothetical protein